MIYVTHDQEEALAIADRVVLMHLGLVVQEGGPEEIYLEPASAFAADFLGVSNRLDATAEAGLLRIGNQTLPYDGPLRGPVLAIVRSSDLSLVDGPAPAKPGAVEIRVPVRRLRVFPPS